ncbi:uncharacterized protein [Eurosta solidaginis]|uniref:uncharacterized protein n=1 Tax=Eurosta solidaginis TaxID=178769 RepID=UPI003530999F
MGNNSDNETVDENQPPAAGESTPSFTTEDDEATVVPKHLRNRYWTSFEEMRLVELWLLHSDEVTTLKKNIPIFRKIAEGMREYGFLMNAQEVRRKINNVKNRYISERRLMELRADKTSDWRLYPLVHCLLAPRPKNQQLLHQKLIIDQLFAKIPVDLLNKELPESEIEQVKPVATSLPLPASSIPIKPPEPLSTPTNTTQYTRFQPYIKGLPNESAIMLSQNFTKERLTQLMMDNTILSNERNALLKQFKSEERSFRALESFLMNWQKKHENLLERLEGDVETGA